MNYASNINALNSTIFICCNSLDMGEKTDKNPRQNEKERERDINIDRDRNR